MGFVKVAAKIAGGAVLLGAAASGTAAAVLYKRVIPRQDKIRVNLDEMADMKKWEQYKKIIGPNKEWLMAQNLEYVNIQSDDGLKLQGYYLPAEEPSDKLAICLHGYTSCGLSDCSSVGAFLHRQGFDVLIIDSRAHGKSEGKYIGFGILERFDTLAWINYINERFDKKKNILLYGISMGGATVLMTAGCENLPDNVKAIVADCAFTSPDEIFSHVLKKDYKLPKFPIMKINEAMCKARAGYGFTDYSTIEAMKHAPCPIMFIHGSDDKFVPTWMSEKNYEACVAPKELLFIDGAGHGAAYYENSELYEKRMLEFINKHM